MKIVRIICLAEPTYKEGGRVFRFCYIETAMGTLATVRLTPTRYYWIRRIIERRNSHLCERKPLEMRMHYLREPEYA